MPFVWLVASFITCCLLAPSTNEPTSQPVAQPRISVERVPATVQRTSFDPKNPGGDMPRMNPREHALTQYDFNCAVNLKYEVTDRAELPGGRVRVTAAVRAIDVRLTLDNRIFLPDNANLPLRSHEEGHREINERVYDETGESIARALAEQVMDKTWTGEGADEDAAGKAATDAAVRELGDGYIADVDGRASRIGDVFDEITQHGRRPVNVARAVQLAFDRDRDRARAAAAPATSQTSR